MHEKLSAHYGSESIFRDINNIRPAANFRRVIRQTLGRADVVLVVMGPRWRGPVDGKYRIDEINDWVRVEVETALLLDVPIIPVLIDGAEMPKPEHLPESLKELTDRQAVRVDPGKDFPSHMNRLIEAINGVLLSSTPPPHPAPVAPAGPIVPPPTPTPAAMPSTAPSFLGRIALPVRIRKGESALSIVGKVLLLLLYYYVWILILGGLVALLQKL
jgi:hypothetical protein